MRSTEYSGEIKNKIVKHITWLQSPDRGERADFCYAILNGLTLPQIKLSRALFAAADLREADFSGADLREACFY